MIAQALAVPMLGVNTWHLGAMWKVELSVIYRKPAVLSVLQAVITHFRAFPLFSYSTGTLCLGKAVFN